MAPHQPGLGHICRAAAALLEHDEARRLVGLERTSPELRRRRVAGRRERPGRAALLPDPATGRLRAAEIRPAAARRRVADGAVSARRVLRHGHDEAARRAVARGAR